MAQATYTSNLDAILEAMKNGIEAGVSEAVEKIAAKARQLCPVGTAEKGPRKSFYLVKRVFLRGAKGRFTNSKHLSTRTKRVSKFPTSWTARRPGALRDSIFTRVRWKDGVCLGWVKAGAEGSPDGSAFYAPFVEWGTTKMKAKPFMRPALRGVDLTDIGMAIGLEIGQTTRRGVKKKTYGT